MTLDLCSRARVSVSRMAVALTFGLLLLPYAQSFVVPSALRHSVVAHAASVSADPVPLNIVPAIDVYAKVPPTKFDVRSLQPGSAVERWASERSPGGDDPFKLVAQELAPFSDNIKVNRAPSEAASDIVSSSF